MNIGLVIVNIDGIADLWQIPVTVIKSFITDYELNPVCPEEWFVKHPDIILKEKRKAFEAKLFGPVFSKSTN